MSANLIIEYPIPMEAAQALRIVQREVPDAIVAGGCLRDAINDRPINDIDIFVPEDRVWRAQRAIKDTHPTLTKEIPEPYFTFNNDVRVVRYYEGKGVLPVNIIGVTNGTCTPEQQLDRFDFGICRVAYDGVRLWKAFEFDRDQRDQTFTLLVAQFEGQRSNSMHRFARLQAKYPGWKFVDASPKPHVWDL